MILAKYLKDNAMKASEFAALVGVKPPAVSKWIKGDRYPSRALRAKISEVTGGKVTSNDFDEIPA